MGVITSLVHKGGIPTRSAIFVLVLSLLHASMSAADEGSSATDDVGATDDDHTSSSHEESSHTEDFGLSLFVLALAFGVVARQINAGARLAHYSTSKKVLELLARFPYTVFVLLLGFFIGALVDIHKDTFGEELTSSINKWTNVSPSVILFAFIPILLFESSFSTDVHIVRHEASQILFLAGPGVLISTTLTAYFVYYVFDYGWSLTLCFMFGGMMSATDPVAVVALFKELGVNERLGTLIEGEGLLNDGTAIVIFNICLQAIGSSKELHVGTVFTSALRLSVGGPVVGLVIGAAMSFMLGSIINDLQSEVTLTVVGCYSCFLIAEGSSLHVSGVLAVVFCGLYCSFYARGKISVKVEHSLHSFWHIAEYVADTVIFFIAGVVMAVRITSTHSATDWLKLLYLYVAIHVIRFIAVATAWPVLKRGYGLSAKEAVVLVFGGLRGAIGLSLALIMEDLEAIQEEPNADTIVFHMAGVALMTLIINGTLMDPLIHGLGLDRVSKVETEMFEHSCAVIEAKLEQYVENELKPDRFLGDADYSLVWRYMPVLSAQQYWHRINSKKISMTPKEKTLMRAIQAEERHRKMSSQSFTLDDSVGSGRLNEGWSSIGGTTLSRLESQTIDGGEEEMKTTETAYTRDGDSVHFPSENEVTRFNSKRRHPHQKQQAERIGEKVVVSLPQRIMRSVESSPVRTMWSSSSHSDPASRSHSNLNSPDFRSAAGQENTVYIPSIFEHIPLRLRRYWYDCHRKHAANEPSVEDQVFQTGAYAISAAAAAAAAAKTGVPTVLPTRDESFTRPRKNSHESVDPHRRRPKRRNSKTDLTRKLIEHREILAQQLRVVEEELRKNQAAVAQRNIRRRLAARQAAMKESNRRITWNHSTPSDIELKSLRRLKVQSSIDYDESPEGVAHLEAAMPQARTRFITAVRAQYQANHHVGRMSAHALRTLRESADRMLDNPLVPLHDWDFLLPKLQMSPRLQNYARRFSKVPIVGKVLFNLVYEHLAFMQELASEFVHAHHAIDIYELLDKGEVADQLFNENIDQMTKVHELLQSQLPAFPEIAHALKTQMAVRQLLMFHARVIDQLVEHGSITEREYELFSQKSDEMQSKVRSHPLTEQLPQRFEMLSKADFLQDVPDHLIERIAESNSCCHEFFVEPSVTLFEFGSTGVYPPTSKRFLSSDHRNGWFLVVRGMVRKVKRSTATTSPSHRQTFDDQEFCLGDRDDASDRSNMDEPGEDDEVEIIQPGTTFGMREQLLGQFFRSQFRTSSYCHLIFIDTASYLKEAIHHKELFEALFRAQAVHCAPKLLSVKLRLQAFALAKFIEIKNEPYERTIDEDDEFITAVLGPDEACTARTFYDLSEQGHVLTRSASFSEAKNSRARRASFALDTIEGQLANAVSPGGHRGSVPPVVDLPGKAPAWHRHASMAHSGRGIRVRSMSNVFQPHTPTPGGERHSIGSIVPQVPLVTPQQLLGARHAKHDIQHVVELWKDRWYLLLRGRVIGRAHPPLDITAQTDIINRMKTLAESSAMEETIQAEDLKLFQGILEKIQKAKEESHDAVHQDPVSERWAPTLLKNMNGRIRVSTRTVIMELPEDFKACRAAMKFLNLIRRGVGDSPGSGPSGTLLGEVNDKPMSFSAVVDKLRAMEAVRNNTPQATPFGTPLATPRRRPSPSQMKRKDVISGLTYVSDDDDEDHPQVPGSLLSRVSERLTEEKFERRSLASSQSSPRSGTSEQDSSKGRSPQMDQPLLNADSSLSDIPPELTLDAPVNPLMRDLSDTTTALEILRASNSQRSSRSGTDETQGSVKPLPLEDF